MLEQTPVVLVVEPDPDVADLYAAWLGESEWRVRVAHDERAGLAALPGADVVVLGAGVADDGALLDVVGKDDASAVVVTDDDAVPAVGERLNQPVSAESLRRAVSGVLARREYARGVGELFSLASERAAAESGREEVPDERRRELEARVDELRDRLDDTLDDLAENAGFDAAYRVVEDVSDED